MIGRTQLSEVEHDEEFQEQTGEAKTFADGFIKELDLEANATRKCLERVPLEKADWKPHEKSMEFGYLAVLVAEIPKWISLMIEGSEIDFATMEHLQPKNSEELVRHFDENIESAKKTLRNLSADDLSKPFYLKNSGEILVESNKSEMLEPVINHLVHHRGQLTVYLRLNDIDVPSVYGPSADDRSF